MLFVRRIREFLSTLRFRLVMWITLVVSCMVGFTYFTIGSVEQQTLRAGYDQFLKDSIEDVQAIVLDHAENMAQLQTALQKKVKDNESRTWFVEIFDDKKNLIWHSINSP